MYHQQQQPKSTQHEQSQSWLNDVKSLFKDQIIQNYIIKQISSVRSQCQSVIVIYQKLFIKFKPQPQNQDSSLYMLKISKSFPLRNSVRLYLLDGPFQPKVFDTRDLLHELLGKPWTYDIELKQIIDRIPELEQKLAKRNENYLALQKTGEFLLGDVFVYNELQQHTSLTIFIDKSQPTTNILNAVSQTHLLTFQRVVKKAYKSKQQQDYQMKSKTLYGKKFMLSKFCDLQCIDSMQVSIQSKQISLNIVKYRSLKSFSDFQQTTKKIAFNDEQSVRQFIRIVLKNLPKYQSTKISFLPSYDKSAPQSRQDISIQKVLQLNQLQQRLQSRQSNGSKSPTDPTKKQQLVNRLNKSYQKMIEYYSARANPYYLIYVNKLNWLYQKYFVDEKTKASSLIRKSSLDQNNKGDFQKDFIDERKDHTKSKNKLVKSLTVDY